MPILITFDRGIGFTLLTTGLDKWQCVLVHCYVLKAFRPKLTKNASHTQASRMKLKCDY